MAGRRRHSCGLLGVYALSSLRGLRGVVLFAPSLGYLRRTVIIGWSDDAASSLELEVAVGKTALDARITRSLKLGHPISAAVHGTRLGPRSLTTKERHRPPSAIHYSHQMHDVGVWEL